MLQAGCLRNILNLALFICFFSLAGESQNRLFPLAFNHLTTENGLSHGTVYTILQDRFGLIWIGTRYGLNRFDGYDCKVFLPIEDNANSLSGPTVLTLQEDKKGKIWIGCREAGISIWDYRKGHFERFRASGDTEIDWGKITVRSIYEDSRGWIWVGTLGSGAFVFDENRKMVERLCTQCLPNSKSLSGDFVFDFVEDGKGQVWIVTDGRGINAYDLHTGIINIVNSGDSLNFNSYEKSLCLDPKGDLWIGTAGSGLYRYNLTTKKIEHFLTGTQNITSTISHNIITDLAIDSPGRLWIATDGGGINIFDPVTNEFQYAKASEGYPQALNTNAIYHLLFDDTGNLWVGTFNGGVNISKAFAPPFLIHENQFDYKKKGLRSVLALKEDTAGKIWIGTDGGGMFYVERNGQSIELLTPFSGKGLPKPVITCLETANDGTLWAGTFADGLILFDPQSGSTRNYKNDSGNPSSLSHNNVWDIQLDKNGGLWIATLGGGLNFLPPGSNKFRRFQPEFGNSNSLPSVQIVDILLDRNGEYLWAASEDKGLSRLHISSGEFKRINQSGPDSKRLSGDNLQCLFQDKNGNIWIGTEFKGMNCLLPETDEILFFDTRDGLPSNMINSIEQDDQGLLWICTPKGIVRWNPDTHAIIDIGTDENLKNNQYNPRASLRLKNGHLVFGGTNGFSIINPKQLHLNPQPPEAIFTDFRLSGQTVPIGKWNGRTVLSGNLNEASTMVWLKYVDRGIVFEFTASDYTNPAKNKFAYQLEGFEETWNYVSAGQHRAVYSKLEGGKYLLKIKAANSDNAWGPVRTLRIVVSPPFWEAWWFYLMCIVLAVSITYLVFRYFLEHQKTVFQEKSFKAEQEIMRLKNENLEKQVEAKQARLSASVLQSAHKNQFLADLKDQILKIEFPEQEKQRRELRKLIRAIDSELDQDDYWEQFQLSFNQMHQDFVHELHHRHPQISGNDLRLCCFVRMGFSNIEIASILNITVNGVEQSKYRLKKKLELEKDASLNQYIWNL